MNRALPLLASRDLAATFAFYQRLGFTSRGAPHEEWDYLIIEHDGCELHFVGPVLGRACGGLVLRLRGGHRCGVLGVACSGGR